MTEVAHRLRLAREAAGFASAAEACARHGWTYSTYAGHENGTRGVRLDRLAVYARAFRVSAAWLATGQSATATAPATPAQDAALHPHSGLAEPALAPFTPPNAAIGHSVEALAAALAAGWRHLVFWTSARDFTPYSIAAGDIIAIGTPPRATDGDVVLVTFGDPDSVTLPAQRAGSGFVLPPGMALPTGQPAVLGTLALVIRATVTG